MTGRRGLLVQTGPESHEVSVLQLSLLVGSGAPIREHRDRGTRVDDPLKSVVDLPVALVTEINRWVAVPVVRLEDESVIVDRAISAFPSDVDKGTGGIRDGV